MMIFYNMETVMPAVSARARFSREYPDWWLEAWQRSPASRLLQFVGDNPLIPDCGPSPNSGQGYPFLEPGKYLHNSKNPCWYEQPRTKTGLRCLPYVYLAGVAKCGTSDISRRLRMHPDVITTRQKEYHWWERYRFRSDDDDEEDTSNEIANQIGVPFEQYLDQIAWKEIQILQRELTIKKFAVKIFGDYSPSYFWDPQYWHLLDGNQGCLEPRFIVGQHIHHVFPGAKILLAFRHPTTRLYSRYLAMIKLRKASVVRKLSSDTGQDFHRFVVDSIAMYKKCFSLFSIRHCAYNGTMYKFESTVRLVEGMYPVFMADWLRVWPREQMHLMRYEDYGGQERERLREIFAFLGLAPLNSTEMDRVMGHEIVNSGASEYEKYGGMLTETKHILDDFYQPFIHKFAELLADDRFLWEDVYE
ncbi:carbohydrate sulfotransferase 15-like [Littorina saxatilis]|uniref:carbohydrate sulfotransferase 15-like n=1 Tax=Littorina saxatilis TaxID=31220 RepID=UPI0038B558C6